MHQSVDDGAQALVLELVLSEYECMNVINASQNLLRAIPLTLNGRIGIGYHEDEPLQAAVLLLARDRCR